MGARGHAKAWTPNASAFQYRQTEIWGQKNAALYFCPHLSVSTTGSWCRCTVAERWSLPKDRQTKGWGQENGTSSFCHHFYVSATVSWATARQIWRPAFPGTARTAARFWSTVTERSAATALAWQRFWGARNSFRRSVENEPRLRNEFRAPLCSLRVPGRKPELRTLGAAQDLRSPRRRSPKRRHRRLRHCFRLATFLRSAEFIPPERGNRTAAAE